MMNDANLINNPLRLMTSGSSSCYVGISMSLGAIIKRHKRTLINFQENFLIPFVEKAAWRYMQFEPELYPISDYKFNSTSTLGIIAREYEVTQLVQLLQTMGQDSPLYATLVQSVIDNMNLSNREELIAKIQQASQPDPQEEQIKMQQLQSEMAFQGAQTNLLNAQSQESQSRAMKYKAEVQMMPAEMEIDLMKVASTSLDESDRDFQRRVEIAKLLLEEQKQGGSSGSKPEIVQ